MGVNTLVGDGRHTQAAFTLANLNVLARCYFIATHQQYWQMPSQMCGMYSCIEALEIVTDVCNANRYFCMDVM